jgi:hypothetical protein
MALAAEMETLSDFNLTAVVSVDCVSPLWDGDDVPKDPADCDINATVSRSTTAVLWAAAYRVLPLGIIRMLISSGFGGFADTMRLLPEDLQPFYKYGSGTQVGRVVVMVMMVGVF